MKLNFLLKFEHIFLDQPTCLFPKKEECALGELDYATVKTFLQQPKKKRVNSKFTENERYLIGKYTAINGPSAAVKKFKKSHSHLKFGESTARNLREKYCKVIKNNANITKIPKAKLGRPLMLGNLDEQVKNFLLILRRKGGVVNRVVAKATANALISRSNDEYLKSIDLENSSWARSLFTRMGFVKRAVTTNKPELPERALNEAKIIFQHQIATVIEDHSIPASLVMNFDQTPMKFAPVSSRTLSKKGSKHVAICGITYRKAITATFGITYTNKFLPMQLIYGGKTERCYPRFDFPESFSLSCNPKHFSNTQESVKLIEEIIIPYLKEERQNLNLLPDHWSLLIIDVFSGQMTDPVLQKLRDNHIKLVRVPPNMTHLFQPLDLTVNGAAKSYLKRRFTEWFSAMIAKDLDAGKPMEEIEVKLQLSTLKPLHAQWVVDLYNYLTSEKGQEVIANGWRSAGITEAISVGSHGLPNLDPFHHVDPLYEETSSFETAVTTGADIENFVTPKESFQSDSEDEWEPDGEADDNSIERNIFEILEDDES